MKWFGAAMAMLLAFTVARNLFAPSLPALDVVQDAPDGLVISVLVTPEQAHQYELEPALRAVYARADEKAGPDRKLVVRGRVDVPCSGDVGQIWRRAGGAPEYSQWLADTETIPDAATCRLGREVQRVQHEQHGTIEEAYEAVSKRNGVDRETVRLAWGAVTDAFTGNLHPTVLPATLEVRSAATKDVP